MSDAGDSRAKVLGSIRQSLKGARHLPPAPQFQAGQNVTSPPGAPDSALAERFAAELGQLGGQFVSLASVGVAAWLLGLMRERDTRDLLAWQAAELPVPGVLDALRAAGVNILDTTLPHDEPARSAALDRIERATFGLTGADAAFAETGSLALISGPGRPRLASLSVRMHVALLDPKRLYPSWAAWLAAEGQAATQRLVAASNLTLITGPSRTADIEMTLTVGVHGPGELIVALVT